jgi:hypothetical protein
VRETKPTAALFTIAYVVAHVSLLLSRDRIKEQRRVQLMEKKVKIEI